MKEIKEKRETEEVPVSFRSSEMTDDTPLNRLLSLN